MSPARGAKPAERTWNIAHTISSKRCNRGREIIKYGITILPATAEIVDQKPVIYLCALLATCSLLAIQRGKYDFNIPPRFLITET